MKSGEGIKISVLMGRSLMGRCYLPLQIEVIEKDNTCCDCFTAVTTGVFCLQKYQKTKKTISFNLAVRDGIVKKRAHKLVAGAIGLCGELVKFYNRFFLDPDGKGLVSVVAFKLFV